MATHASEADLDTIVPGGDEDGKVCEEGMRLMAEQLLPGPPAGRENPKKRGVGNRLGTGREADASAAIFFMRVISQERLEGHILSHFTPPFCPLEEQKGLKGGE